MMFMNAVDDWTVKDSKALPPSQEEAKKKGWG
jgi:hypothetical protein